MATLLSERGQSRCHGPGASPRSACLDSAPLPTIARGKELRPNPIGSDTSCRRPCRSPAGVAGIVGAPARGALSRACLTWSAEAIRVSRGYRFRGTLGQGRLTRSPAKGSALRCTRGAFRRWTNPCRGSPRHPQAVPSLWKNGADAFSIIVLLWPLTRLRTTRGLGRACVRPASKSRAHHRIDRSASEQLLRSVQSAA
jgi:hypothetical protein